MSGQNLFSLLYPRRDRDLTDCANYRTTALITHLSKILLLVILERLKATLEGCLSEEQAGFIRDRSTVQQILTLRLIAEKYLQRDKHVYNCFIDYTKAFDSVWHEGLWEILPSFQHPAIIVGTDTLESVYLNLSTLEAACRNKPSNQLLLLSPRRDMQKTIWTSVELSTMTKIDVLVSCVFSHLLYAAETWTMKAADARKLLAFEMRC